jgi:hypothetical protein
MLSRLIRATKVFESVTSQKAAPDDNAEQNPTSRRKALKHILLGTALGLAVLSGVGADAKGKKSKKSTKKSKKSKKHHAKPKSKKTPKSSKKSSKPHTTHGPHTSKNPSPKSPPRSCKTSH